MPNDVTAIVGSSNLYHKPECQYVGRVWNRNREDYTALDSASFRAALDGLSPCQTCNPPHDPDWRNLAADLAVIRRTESIDVAVMKRRATTMLDRIFGPDAESGRSLRARVLDLKRDGRVPQDVANCLHMICDLRNMAEHPHNGELTPFQTLIARLCWALIEQWSARHLGE